MLNSKIFDWVFLKTGKEVYPELNKPVFILIEHDVIFDSNEQFPFTRRASWTVINKGNTMPGPHQEYNCWKLLDYDPFTEEEILQQCFSVVAYRYYTDYHEK